MKITLKHILLCSIALVTALFFIIGLVVPITVSFAFNAQGAAASFALPAGKFSGSLLSIQSYTDADLLKIAALNGGSIESTGLYGAVYYDIYVTVLTGGSASGGYAAAAAVLAGVYKVLAIIGLVIAILCVVATIGAFFIPSMKGARGLTIPFFALLFIWAGVMMGIMSLPGASVSLLNSNATWSQVMKVTIERSAPGVVFMVVSMITFVAMLIVPGVVKEKVLVGKKD